MVTQQNSGIGALIGTSLGTAGATAIGIPPPFSMMLGSAMGTIGSLAENAIVGKPKLPDAPVTYDQGKTEPQQQRPQAGPASAMSLPLSGLISQMLTKKAPATLLPVGG